MLIAKGSHVILKMEDGRIIKPAGTLLHDESGRDFPAKRCLIATFQKTQSPIRKNKWFGPDYDPRAGQLTVPGTRAQLTSISNWDDLGDVKRIEYTRVGKHAANYHHGFRSEAYPTLYKRGKVYCLVMRKGTTLNWRGFVEPGQ
jgi:hypothetical protein